ncbi:MAG: hypothetical protein NTU43_00705 [Bacteroidetes bacterium]|nr:hypothetical protein [Bacteroidota bacterium]
MNIDKSKVFAIQSHEWGGQLFLRINESSKFVGITLNSDEKNKFNGFNTAIHDLSYYQNESILISYFALIPSLNSSSVGAFHLVSCSFNNPSNAIPPSVPRIPIYPGENNLDGLLYGKKNIYNAEMGDFTSFINRFKQFVISNPPNSFYITHILSKKPDGLYFVPYNSSNSYDTLLNIVEIPNITNVSDVFLFKMKSNDIINEEYLGFDFIPDEGHSTVELNFSSKINRAHLWNLIRIK